MNGLENPTEEGNGPVDESELKQAVSGVPQDTRNPAGRQEDHLLRLNTT